MSQDLGLDPSDPLNLLLHNRSQHDVHTDTDTDSAATPPDWSSLSLWAAADDSNLKIDPSFDVDFDGLMDMSFGPNVGIEPAALNYQPYPPVDPFPAFPYGSPHMSSAASSESGSTSGSFSPHVAYSPPSSDYTDEDPATELASRVRKTAGIMLAVQMHEQQPQQPIPAPVQRVHPIQTQPQPTPISQSPVFTTAPVAGPVVSAATTTVPSSNSRPKTSHTTIERRYRTNLNARIQSLRAAVPALRVVDRAAAIKAGEAVADDEDVIDARGYVDGVKVARKCSKANVLGKAVEYIRVLKNREHRLARELAGLKTLLGGLVGGNELLREWEREWTARFGGPETDEIIESTVTIDEEADDEDDDSDDDGAGRKRKKPKIVPEVKPKPERKPAPPVVEGEKKKRGRPRKIVPPPATAPPAALSTSIPMKQEPQQRQYLLGAFALFSFFANAPSSSQHHAHEGHVLTRLQPNVESISLLQLFHLLVSVAVLASVVLPLGKGVYSRLWSGKSQPVDLVLVEKAPPSPVSSDDSDDTDDVDTDLSLSSIGSDETLVTELTTSSPVTVEAEACILNDSTPLSTRIHTAVRLCTASAPSRRLLLALLLHPVPVVGKRVAGGLWGSQFGLAIEEAARRANHITTKDGVLRTLEESVAVDHLRDVSAEVFVRDVLGSSADEEEIAEKQQHALEAARVLGGRVGVLGSRVGRVLGGGSLEFDEDDEQNEPVDDVERLLRATILFRRVFPSSTPSSVLCTKTPDAYALRRMLGSSYVFEHGAVEEARDRIVDLLTGAH
ncbi:BHLH domain-containing protein [Mycena chlorophos]|uniref:BHLH domain-containing protein n=1 Tax=Mycena chlorophos TaxID=658473 RepID=A0A8H6TJ14_MYCCL|nr:BHLH domain-containing protein [Mycena chlorophos]